MQSDGGSPGDGAGGDATRGPPRPPREGEGAGGDGRPSQLVEVDVEREVIGTSLYRERAIVEEVVEEEAGPGAVARRRRAERRATGRAAARPSPEGLRATLGYKVFYDLVCNRLGVVLMGFGLALLLFSVLYDPMRHEPLSIGPRQLMAMVVAGVVYFVGMAFEMLRAWSPECEGEPEAPDVAPRPPADGGDAPMPMVPEEALEKLVGRTDGDVVPKER